MAEKILKGKIVAKDTEITVLSAGDADDYIRVYPTNKKFRHFNQIIMQARMTKA